MKSKIDFLKKTPFLFVLLFFSHCEPQKQNNAALELYVITILSELQANAKVTLYNNERDWAREENPIDNLSKNSNAQGRVRFLGLWNQTYYIDIQKDSLNNWEAKNSVRIETKTAFELVKELIIVGKSESGLLASAKGKKWKLVSTLPASLACRTDDFMVFYKGNRRGEYELLENEKSCSTNANPVLKGEWEVKEGVLSTKINGNLDFEGVIVFLSADLMEIETNFLGRNFSLVYEVVRD